MLTGQMGGDPYVFYKLHHAWRAEKAWLLSVDLKFYEAFRDGPASLEEVCRRTGLARRPASVLLAANACMGILGVRDGRHFLYDSVRELVLEGGRARYPAEIPAPGTDPDFDRWKQAVLTNRPVPEDLPDWIRCPDGSPEVTAHVPARHQWRVLWGEAVAAAFDFSPYRLVVDLGGATGGLLAGVTSRCPQLRGVAFDLPYSRAGAESALAASGAGERVRFVAGDFFRDPYPADADVLIMSHIIHDWDDEHCLQLLRRCHDALPRGSPVLVQEFLLNDDKTGPMLAVFQWFGMLRGTTGDQRTAGEIGALLAQVGFRDMETRPIDGEQSLVIGWKR